MAFGADPAFSGVFSDSNVIRRLGNLTSTSNTEQLVTTRPYVEPASQAQRSVVSTSTQDANPSGTGARAVRITYLNSSYVRFTEDILLNGTTPVNTVATDIRFIESMAVIRGTAAVGAVRLMTTTGGGGSEICGIAAATTDTFLCHHYVAAGVTAYILGWGATIDDEGQMKLVGQARHDPSFLVDPYIWDLEKMFASNPTPPTRLTFERFHKGGMLLNERTYTRVTVVPNQNTSTVIRAWLYIWEQAS